MKQVESESCTFCNLEVETITHFFWHCQTAQFIWQNVETWVKQKTNRNITFTLENTMFCDTVKKPIDCVNTIVLITKQYLYSARCLKQIPNFDILKQKIINIHNIEKYIAVSNDKLKKHNKRWLNFI